MLTDMAHTHDGGAAEANPAAISVKNSRLKLRQEAFCFSIGS
jgi:hypothetical protein